MPERQSFIFENAKAQDVLVWVEPWAISHVLSNGQRIVIHYAPTEEVSIDCGLSEGDSIDVVTIGVHGDDIEVEVAGVRRRIEASWR